MRLHVVTLSVLLSVMVDAARGQDELPLNQDWAKALVEAVGEQPLGPVESAQKDARLGLDTDRVLALRFERWTVRRAIFRDAATLRSALVTLRPDKLEGHILQVRGRQLVMVQGAWRDPLHALPILDAAWGARCRAGAVVATVVVLPSAPSDPQFVVTTTWAE